MKGGGVWLGAMVLAAINRRLTWKLVREGMDVDSRHEPAGRGDGRVGSACCV